MRNFKDESFVGQFLSPRLMREMRLFSIVDDEKERELEVAAIHDEAGYRRVREALSHQYDLGSREPNIQVWNVNLRGDRSLTLRHTQHNDRPLARQRAGSAEACRAPVGLRRAPRERRRSRRRDEALVGARADSLSTERAHTLKILPGFMMFFGSSARLIVRIICTAPAPASSTRNPILCRPMPCSPVQVPSSASARCTSCRFSRSAVSRSAGMFGSIR